MALAQRYPPFARHDFGGICGRIPSGIRLMRKCRRPATGVTQWRGYNYLRDGDPAAQPTADRNPRPARNPRSARGRSEPATRGGPSPRPGPQPAAGRATDSDPQPPSGSAIRGGAQAAKAIPGRAGQVCSHRTHARAYRPYAASDPLRRDPDRDRSVTPTRQTSQLPTQTGIKCPNTTQNFRSSEVES